MPKSTKHKQLGGFNIPPEIQNLLSGIDFSNLNFGNLSSVGNLIQPGGNTYQDQVDAFRANPNADDLDTFDDNLSPGLQRRIARRLRKGKGLNNRQQRKLNSSINASAVNQEAGVQDVRNTGIGNFGQAVNSAFAEDNPDLIAESFGQGLANIGAQQGLGTAPELLQTMNDQYGGVDQIFNFLSGLTDFQYGGKLGSAMQSLGYSDGSPFEGMDKIRIKGNQIDMSNTGKRLLLIPDKGEPREVEPYSGVHVFEGASEILEVPLGKKGGKVALGVIVNDKGFFKKVNEIRNASTRK